MTIQSTSEACEAAALISSYHGDHGYHIFLNLPACPCDRFVKPESKMKHCASQTQKPEANKTRIITVTTVSKLSTHGQGLTEGMVWVMPRPRDDRRLLMLGCAYD